MIARVSWAREQIPRKPFSKLVTHRPTDPKCVSNTWGNLWLAKNNNKNYYHDNNHNNDDNDNDNQNSCCHSVAGKFVGWWFRAIAWGKTYLSRHFTFIARLFRIIACASRVVCWLLSEVHVHSNGRHWTALTSSFLDLRFCSLRPDFD